MLTVVSITFDIPADIESELEGIPDLDARVALFLRHEIRLEALRRQRFSPEARAIAARALKAAEVAKKDGLDWDGSFSRLREQHDGILSKL